MSELYTRVIESVAQPIEANIPVCEAFGCSTAERVRSVRGPGGVPLKLCPEHRTKLLGGDNDA